MGDIFGGAGGSLYSLSSPPQDEQVISTHSNIGDIIVYRAGLNARGVELIAYVTAHKVNKDKLFDLLCDCKDFHWSDCPTLRHK
jgi:hypothetical protein